MPPPDPSPPDHSAHAQDRNFLESILRYIPGFRGYLEQEYRRESDYLARSWMADKLQASKRGLDDYMRGLIDSGQIDGLTACERLRTRIDSLVLEMRGAVRGYSGVFDYVRVREATLDAAYQADYALMSAVDALAAEIAALGGRTDPPSTIIPGLLARLEDLDQRFDRRGRILQGLEPA